MSQYGEPWRLEPQRNGKLDEFCMEAIKADGKVVLSADNWDGVCPKIPTQQRIVAAMNVCAGTSDAFLKKILDEGATLEQLFESWKQEGSNP